MIREQILTKLRSVYRELTPDEQAVATVLADGKPHQQDDLARRCPQIKTDLHRDGRLRQIRQIVHDLRVKHGVVIVSSPAGYWIPDSREEVENYLDVSQLKARAAAKSFMQTYHIMVQNIEHLSPRDTLFEL